jgi:hypothetical protein
VVYERQSVRFHLRAAIEFGWTPFVFDFAGLGSPLLDAEFAEPFGFGAVVLALLAAVASRSRSPLTTQ